MARCKRFRDYVTTRDIVIPAGTRLKEWHGRFEAIIGITKDSCAYFYMDEEDITYSDGFCLVAEEGKDGARNKV